MRSKINISIFFMFFMAHMHVHADCDKKEASYMKRVLEEYRKSVTFLPSPWKNAKYESSTTKRCYTILREIDPVRGTYEGPMLRAYVFNRNDDFIYYIESDNPRKQICDIQKAKKLQSKNIRFFTDSVNLYREKDPTVPKKPKYSKLKRIYKDDTGCGVRYYESYVGDKGELDTIQAWTFDINGELYDAG